MLALEQSAEKWPFSTNGEQSSDRSEPPWLRPDTAVGGRTKMHESYDFYSVISGQVRYLICFKLANDVPPSS